MVVDNRDKIIIKPNVYSWRWNTVKNMFMSAYKYKAGTSEHNTVLDSHMMKNTEWGAIAYLSHSKYGIRTDVNLNNNNNLKTGYSATANTNQRTYPGETGSTNDPSRTQPWNSTDGYLASTTGNISGVYDMSGGAWEYMASCIDENPGKSGFNNSELKKYMDEGYIDRYDKNSNGLSYDKRILDDATGELGPFYNYLENLVSFSHSSWYADLAIFLSISNGYWFLRGGGTPDGVVAGQFDFQSAAGEGGDHGFRVVLAPN